MLFTGLFNDEDMECCTIRQERVQRLGLQTSGVSHPGGSKCPTANLWETGKSRRDIE